jgi:hypothetical protein
MAMQNFLRAVSQPLGLNEGLNSTMRFRREFENGQRDDKKHQHAPVDRRDCPGEEHERESQVMVIRPGQASERRWSSAPEMQEKS